MPSNKNINYIHFDTVDSTNTWAKNNASLLDPDQITCITALEQTAGRGRWARQWLSPRGQNIYASLYLCVPLQAPYLSNLGQLISLSCATVLKKKGFNPQIKWPNDLLLEGKKVAGILTETIPFEDRLGVVLGIGINVNMTKELLDTIDQPATSLAQLSGHTWTLEQVLEPLLKQFSKDLLLLQTKGFAVFQEVYESLLAFKGKEITCYDGEEELTGICHSIRPDGQLNLVLPSGVMRVVVAGEIRSH